MQPRICDAVKRLQRRGSQHWGMSREDRHRGSTQTGINLAAALARLSKSHEHEEAKDSAHRDAQVAFSEEPEHTEAAAGRCQTGLGLRCSF